MDLQQKIRKNQNQMVMFGSMLRYFGAWTFIKILLLLVLNNSVIENMIYKQDYNDLVTTHIVLLAMEVIILLLVAVYSLLFIYVAKCAIEEGKNIKKHRLFLVGVAFILIITTLDIVVGIIFIGSEALWDFIISLVMDSFTLFIIICLINSTLFLRKQKTISKG